MKPRLSLYIVLLCAVLMALSLPTLTAAEISLPEPLTDLTLVLNEPVTIQLPHGITDNTDQSGKWKHQIKNINVKGKRRRPLPSGITYDPATRTLSGAPTEEYDMTHNYIIEYRVGKRRAKNKIREELSVPFRLIVRHPIDVRIRDFIGEARSVNDFVSGLPQYHRNEALFMIKSQAGDADFVSKTTPRIISFGLTARNIFSWGTNPNSPRYDQVEFIFQEEDTERAGDANQWHFGVIDFSHDSPRILRKQVDALCQTCHDERPLWAKYPVWPGTIDETTILQKNVLSESERRELRRRYRNSADVRTNSIRRSQTWGLPLPNKPNLLTELLAARQAQFLVNRMRQETTTEEFNEDIKDILCGNRVPGRILPNILAGIQAYFSSRERGLHLMLNENGQYVDISPRNIRSSQYVSNVVSLERMMALLLIKQLYDTNEEVHELYENSPNTDMGNANLRYAGLHFRPGRATAADELNSYMKLIFLSGQAYHNYRAGLRGSFPEFDLGVAYRLENKMYDKLCNLLNEDDEDAEEQN